MVSFVQNLGSSADVVVIDDEASIREGCRQALESEGYRALLADNGIDGLEMVKQVRPRVVLLDLRMPGISGVEVLDRLPGIDPRIIPIVITGYGSVDTAVNSMRRGAFDFISKPFDVDALLNTVGRAMKRYEETVEPQPLAPKAPARPATEPDAILKGLEAVGEFYQAGTQGSLAETLCALESEATYHARKLGRIHEKKKAVGDLIEDVHLVDRVVERHDFRKNALIQIMLDLQSEKRWLPRHMLMWLSRRLNIPVARIYEVAHFYEAFSLEPQGAHTVQVCLGTACHVRRGPQLADSISSVLGVKPGGTDDKLQFTLKQVHCLGCCALAPVIKVDETYYGNPSLDDLKAIFASCEKKEQER
jgi:NADH:ubiquinone oxidoreductase subunit E/DNA-binding response OmpR family regulator